jgi:drug/metabolite transporter (DMT)-like permease
VLAITLAIGASLVYGVSDFLGGLKSRSLALLTVLIVSQGTALVLLAAIVLSTGGDPPQGRYLLYGALAGVSEAVGVAALYRGLAVGVMSVVAPIGATAPVVPVVAALALGETPTAIQGAGILFAVGGVALIAYSGSEESRSRAVGTSVLFGLLTALGFGGFFLAMDAASEGEVQWALMMARLISVTAFVAVFLATRARLDAGRGEVPVLALIGALIIAADGMYAFASTEGLLSVVAVLSSLYPVVTIALARVVLDERIERLQQAGIAVVLGGVVAISAPQA